MGCRCRRFLCSNPASISCPGRGAAPLGAAPQSRDQCRAMDPGSAAHRFTLRSIRGTRSHCGESNPAARNDARVEDARRAKCACALCANCPSRQSAATRRCCRLPQISGISHRPALDKRGASRSSGTLSAGCDGRGTSTDERCCTRTAKSCGPGAPWLASSWRRCLASRR